MEILEDNIMLPFIGEVLKAMFCNVAPDELIKNMQNRINICDIRNKKSLCRILEDTVYGAAHRYFRQELEGYIDYFLNGFSASNSTIYNVLETFSQKMIIRSNNSFCFRYEYTDIWRNFSRYVDEEIVLISSFYNYYKNSHQNNNQYLDFPYCINCDNAEIKNMLKRFPGTSENHFHLRGSSPYFYIAWINLMNHIYQPDFDYNLNNISENSLINYGGRDKKESLSLLCKKASVIRFYLYNLIEGNFQKNEKSFLKVFQYVYNDNIMTFDTLGLQNEIDAYLVRRSYGRNIDSYIDYAQLHKNVINNTHTKYFNLQGERNFVYIILKYIYENKNNGKVAQLFYIYLTIKHRFHEELVQSNQRIGFYNFTEYQNRKDYFIPWSYSMETKIATDTINSIMDDLENIHRVELRITPEETVRNMWLIIKIYDDAIEEAIKHTELSPENNYNQNISSCLMLDKNHCPWERENKIKEERKKFFYTFSFIKFKDTENVDAVYRNYKARNKAWKQAYAISSFIQSRPTYYLDAYSDILSDRIYGIDACAEEIDCRPEVFGVVFRYLQYYIPAYSNNYRQFRQLKATYHVAEDNYDILDAVRAIDEAILFLNLRSGCRLGHATLLGISAETYYREKGNSVSMPKQVWLDNMVWMYYFIKENNIIFNGSALLLDYLTNEFEQYFYSIYSNGNRSGKFNMADYYLSWFLRGDDPKLYHSGVFYNSLGKYQKYRCCYSDDRMQIARKSKNAVHLYYLYYYRKSVKDNGDLIVVKKLPKYFIDGVICVQKRMCQKVASFGIGIETNPTSNLFISTIKKYSEHPISSFYNNGLLKNSESVQLNVSVNTDDKSVFSTSLTNEYTYLLFYLEKNETGSQCYSHFQIMQWLDEIRKMGNEQSFAN